MKNEPLIAVAAIVAGVVVVLVFPEWSWLALVIGVACLVGYWFRLRPPNSP